MESSVSCALMVVAASKLDSRTEVVIVDFESDILSRSENAGLRQRTKYDVRAPCTIK